MSSIATVEIRSFSGPDLVELDGVNRPAIIRLNVGPAGPQGEPGEPGPNSVTSATTSDGTADLSLSSISMEEGDVMVSINKYEISFTSGTLFTKIDAGGLTTTESVNIGDPELGSVTLTAFGDGIFSAGVTSPYYGVTPGGNISLASTNEGGVVSINGEAATDVRIISLPDASGTVALTSQLAITLSGDVTGTGTGSITTTIANGAVTLAKMADIGHEKIIGRHATGAGTPQEVGIDGGLEWNGGNIRRAALTGDISASAGSNTTTLATVNANVGSFGSATQSVALTVNAKGLVTAASASTITPAVGSITGLGTGVATALAVNTGTAGSIVVNGGALGTPSSGTLTSCTGLPISTGVSGLGANVAAFLTTPSSANLRSALTDPTGTGANVHANSPTIVTPTIAQINVASSLLILGAGASGLLGLRSNSATGYSSLELLNSGGTQMGGFGYANASAGSYADQVYYYTNSKALILASFAGRRDLFLSATGDVSIGSGAAANTRAVLDLTSTTKGFLPPRMTTAQRDAITSAPAGLMIYNTSTNKLNFYNGSAWEAVTSA